MIFMSWNVKGLMDLVQKYSFCNEITKVTSLFGKLYFLYLQEVKISKFNMECTSSFLWLGCSMYITNHFHGRGDDITLISSRWKSLLVSWEVDPSNWVVWILFDIDGQPFGVVNVYASNHGPHRCTLWRWLALSLS